MKAKVEVKRADKRPTREGWWIVDVDEEGGSLGMFGRSGEHTSFTNEGHAEATLAEWRKEAPEDWHDPHIIHITLPGEDGD